MFQKVDLNLICVGFYCFQYKLGYLCIFLCAPCFQLWGGRVLFIARGANWGPAKYEGASRVSRSGFESHLRRFLQLSVQTGVFVCFSVCPLFSITGWPCPVHCPWHTLGTRQIRGGNACCWVLGLCVFFSLVAVCPCRFNAPHVVDSSLKKRTAANRQQRTGAAFAALLLLQDTLAEPGKTTDLKLYRIALSQSDPSLFFSKLVRNKQNGCSS